MDLLDGQTTTENFEREIINGVQFMTVVSVVYQSGGGKTRNVAKAIADSAKALVGVKVNLLEIVGEDVINGRWNNEEIIKKLNDSDAILFGCPTYMGSVSAIFKAFLETAFSEWMIQGWKDKFAGGFTNSASQSGDKLSTLIQLNIFAMQMGMIWVGVGDGPGNNWSGGSVNDINRLGSWLGVMAQSNGDQDSTESPLESDLETARRYGVRIASITQKWLGEGEYKTEKFKLI
jgi:NAD(P)H dehydrogenase (quinone)